MEAALIASERGIEVEFWGKEGVLGGGALLAAGSPSFKYNMMNYAEYLVNKLNRSQVKVRMLKDGNAEEIVKGNYGAVIIATGSVPLCPPIPCSCYNMITYANDVLTNSLHTGKKSVIIGDGLIGVETALSLIDQGKGAVVIEMMDQVLPAADHALNSHLKLMDLIAEKKLVAITSAKVLSIANNQLVYEKDGEQHVVACDTVILACGLLPNNGLAKELESMRIEPIVIGDSKSPRKVFNAVHEGYHTARMLFAD
jgi:2-enoate reductase